MKIPQTAIFEMDGVHRKTFEGDYSPDELAFWLIERWVPYIDCDRKCARSDYCTFTKPHPYHPQRHSDIKCGVMAAFIKNYVKSTHSALVGKSQTQFQCYFDGLFYLSQFVLYAEGLIGSSISEVSVDWYGKASPYLFSAIVRLRDELNKACVNLKNLPELVTTSGILFVEGWSERQLIETLRRTNSTWFLDKNVIVYGGSANARPGRIQMLIEDYVANGYTVYLEGDNDGRNVDRFQDIRTKCNLPDSQVFTFRHDLESAVPSRILHRIMVKMYEKMGEVTYEAFCEALTEKGDGQSVIKTLEEEYGVDVERDKIEIADLLGQVLSDPRFLWWDDTEFMKTELGAFMDFLIRMK